MRLNAFIAWLTPIVDIGQEMDAGVSKYVIVDKTNNSQPILRYEVLIEAERFTNDW